MKYTLTTLIAAAAILSACSAQAPAAPEVPASPTGVPFFLGDIVSPPPPTWQPKTVEDLLIGPAAAGPVTSVAPDAPLIGPAASGPDAKDHHK